MKDLQQKNFSENIQGKTLQQTVSTILKKKVSARRAQLFANEEFGVLKAYIKAQVVEDILKYRAENKNTKEYKELNQICFTTDKTCHQKKQKELTYKKRNNEKSTK